MKKLLTIVLSLVFALSMFGLTGCGSNDNDSSDAAPAYSDEFNAFNDSIDLDYAKEVQQKVAAFGDDKALGMRSAGSPAEKKTADYIEQTLKDIGLKNVTVDEATVDGWTFKGASIVYTNPNGEEFKADLGGYQTDIQADNEEIEIVYVGRGTEADYKGIDVTDKLVLFEVNQEEDWWINYPAYQAKLKGARCAIAMREFADMGEGTDDRIGVQDVCGPADAPALAISNKDCKAIKKAIKASGKDSIKVRFSADSKVTPDSTTHNIWGEIPGKTDETIFVFSHIDGYFHSAYDDTQGVAVSIAQAKALVDSGYVPDKTIRFCFHGAEEWGRSGSEYDWSTGAYEEIMTTHPEWAENGFAIVNNDGAYALKGVTELGLRTSIELKPFTKKSIKDISKDTCYKWDVKNISTYTEDFQWTREGVPSIVAGDGNSTKYDDLGYHSNFDSFENMPLNEEGLKDVIRLFGKIIIDLDSCSVRPMDFNARIKNFEKSLNDDAKTQFKDVLAEGYAAADALQAKMDEVEKSGDKDAAVNLNCELRDVYLSFQDSILGLDFIEVDAIVRHDLYEENILNLDATIKALESGDVQTAYDEYLWAIDWSWYDMYFDEETCDYMKNQLFENRDDTWGAGLITYPHADTNAIVVSLRNKYDETDPDLSDEIAQLKSIRDLQKQYLEDTYNDELDGLKETVKLMKKYAE